MLSDGDSDVPTQRRSRRGAPSAEESYDIPPRREDWAFLESSSASSADDSDFERPRHNSKKKNSKPKKTPTPTRSPATVRRSPNVKPRTKNRANTTVSDDEEVEEVMPPRARREASRHVLSDVLTLSELQAQEAELKRLKSLYGANADRGPTQPSPLPPSPPPSLSPPPPTKTKTAGVGRTVLATTLARKQVQNTKDESPSPPPKKSNSSRDVRGTNRNTKRRLMESDEEEDEDDEPFEEEDDDDFELDFVAAKKATLVESLQLTQKNPRDRQRTTRSPAKPTAQSKPATKARPSPRKQPVTPPTPPSKSKAKAKAKTKQPARKQPRLEIEPVVDEPRESRRARSSGMMSELFSVSELQAQELAWARLQRELKLQSEEPSASHRAEPTQKSSAPTKSSRLPGRKQRADSVDSDNSSLDLIEIEELADDENEVKQTDDGDDDFVPSTPQPKADRKKPSGGKKAAEKTKKGPVVKQSTPRKFSSLYTPIVSRSAAMVDDSAPSVPLSKPRTAADTVPHTTAWRSLRAESAPLNLLLLPDTVSPPFASTADRSLPEFDPSGELESKCELVNSFGKTKTFVLSSDTSAVGVSQDKMNERVMELLETWTPKIKGCYERKTEAVVREAREKTTEYMRLRDAHIRLLVDQAVKRKTASFSSLVVSPLEHELTNQLLVPKTTIPLGDSFTMGRGETFLVEKQVVPHVAVQLPVVRPLSRSTIYTGVKSSNRVEDDPILRYVPYFGDNDRGDAIDVKHYESVRPKDTTESSEVSNGLDNETHEYLLRLVVAECGDSESVFNALKQVAGFTQPFAEYGEIKKTRDSRRLASIRMQEIRAFLEDKVKANDEDAQTWHALQTLTQRLFPFVNHNKVSMPLIERLSAQWTYFETNLLPSSSRNVKLFRRLLGLRYTNDYSDLSETYRDLFCRMCYKYDCPEHGIEHPMPTRRVDPLYPATRYALVLQKLEGDEPDDNLHESKSVEDHAGESAEEPEAETQLKNVDDASDSPSIQDATEVDETDADVTDAMSATSQEAMDSSAAPRRSVRSGTRASTLATISAETQLLIQGHRPRAPRPRTKQMPKRTNLDESEYLDESHVPLVSGKVKAFLASDTPCGEGCWKSPQVDADKAPTVDVDEFAEPEELIKAKLTSSELLVLQKLRYSVGDNACMIASVLQSLSCRDVHTFLESQQRSKPVGQQGYFSPDVSGKKNRKRGRTTAALPSNNRELLKRTRHQRLKDTSTSNHDYEPCNHEGICDFGASCSCMKRDHMCEKACSCSRDCPNRFQGCRCSPGNCRTNQCPCFVAMRECNPDLCHTCGAADTPVLIYNKELKMVSARDLESCCNVNVQRELHRKIGVSFSTTHGWGAFALEPILRGEFIYEYTGAIISHDEAERRGSIYDKLNISFLFDLNEDSVVDAIRTGNKSKFCNHVAVGHKCHARIMRVGGEHHISIWAMADINKGEELFFNYGYNGESAPVWSQGARITESKEEEEEDAEEVTADAE